MVKKGDGEEQGVLCLKRMMGRTKSLMVKKDDGEDSLMVEKVG